MMSDVGMGGTGGKEAGSTASTPQNPSHYSDVSDAEGEEKTAEGDDDDGDTPIVEAVAAAKHWRAKTASAKSAAAKPNVPASAPAASQAPPSPGLAAVPIEVAAVAMRWKRRASGNRLLGTECEGPAVRIVGGLYADQAKEGRLTKPLALNSHKHGYQHGHCSSADLDDWTEYTVRIDGMGGDSADIRSYKELLLMALADGVIDEGEEVQLREARNKYNVTEEQHQLLLVEAKGGSSSSVAKGGSSSSVSAPRFRDVQVYGRNLRIRTTPNEAKGHKEAAKTKGGNDSSSSSNVSKPAADQRIAAAKTKMRIAAAAARALRGWGPGDRTPQPTADLSAANIATAAATSVAPTVPNHLVQSNLPVAVASPLAGSGGWNSTATRSAQDPEKAGRGALGRRK
jgi:hypothetical protein